MIDDPDLTARLIGKLREALPLVAGATSQLAAVIREEAPDAKKAAGYPVTRIDYAGDDGGVVCRLEVGEGSDLKIFYVSITHLTFHRRSPFAREIAVYQKHRNKRLKRLHIAELIEEVLRA